MSLGSWMKERGSKGFWIYLISLTCFFTFILFFLIISVVSLEPLYLIRAFFLPIIFFYLFVFFAAKFKGVVRYSSTIFISIIFLSYGLWLYAAALNAEFLIIAPVLIQLPTYILINSLLSGISESFAAKIFEYGDFYIAPAGVFGYFLVMLFYLAISFLIGWLIALNYSRKKKNLSAENSQKPSSGVIVKT